jgi:AcrR family transcriptional regulator
MKPVQRLSPDDWARAALDAIAADGVEAVSVEGLARQLGVTKGSFYWHFADRSALVAAALDLWEQRGTGDIIDALRTITDPAARLKALFEQSFGARADGPVDAALMVHADDPVVGPVVRSVSAQRVAFLEETFRDLGLTPARAAARARITYSTYVGHFQVTRSLPDDPVLSRPGNAYLRQLLTVLVSPDR